MKRFARSILEAARQIDWLLTIFALGGPIALGLTPIILEDDTTLLGFRRNAWMLLGGVIVFMAALLLEGVKRLNERDAKAVLRRACGEVMDVVGQEIWVQSKPPDGPVHEHRVTLFKAYPVWFRSLRRHTHVLKPIARSPKAGGRPRRKFYAHDGDSTQCQGVCGLVWAREVIVSKKLPDLKDESLACDDTRLRDAAREYARLTNDQEQVDLIARKRYGGRVMGGHVVKIGGERWGVLLLDSTDPDALTDKRLGEKACQQTLRVLQGLLAETKARV